MPLYSRFTPYGLLKFSSQPSRAEDIYHSIVSTMGDGFSVEIGSRADAWAYMVAMGLARALGTCERAGNQIHPAKIYEMLGIREAEYQITPGPYDSISQRRGVLASRMLLSQGARRSNVEEGLAAILGDDFAAYRTVETSEIVGFPTALGDQPMNLQRPGVPRKLVRLLDPVATDFGFSYVVRYELVETPAVPGSAAGTLIAGEFVVVEPETLGITETVQVEATGVHADGSPTFQAVYTNAHSAGVIGTTMPYPLWATTQKTALIVVVPPSDIDLEKRRKVHEFMARVATAVSTWAIVKLSDVDQAGAFVIGTGAGLGHLDSNPIEVVTF